MPSKTLEHTSEEVCKLANITYRQLDYWTTLQYATPIRQRNPGSGTPRHYSVEEAVRIRLMAQLVAAGIKPADAHLMTLTGAYDDRRAFHAHLHGNVYVEVMP